MRIVADGKPRAVIVLGKRATHIEQHAAQELARYVQAMSGARLTIARESSKAAARATTRILIGRPESNEAIARLCEQGQLRLSAAYPGGDGFVVKAKPSARGGWLVLGGSSDRATIYAAYHFLEHACDVGFFWDGDHIPRARTIEVGRLNRVEKPRFPIRQHLQGCAFTYTTWPWDWNDWKQEIDWMAKRRQNTMMLDWDHPEAKRVAAYARKLGMKIILSAAALGEVPEDFVKQHPDVRCVKMQWMEDPPYFVIHPSDPMFVERGAQIVRKNIASFGTDHIYNADPYSEQTVFLPEAEVAQMRVEYARRTAEYMRAADSQAIWYASGWALYLPEWPKETARAFFEAIPAGMPFYICDIYADEEPIYKRYNYFHGRDWGFGVLHAFGGDDTMRGDLAGLIDRVNSAANDPGAKHLVAFYINPEMIRHNILFYELAARLSWTPERVSLPRFLSDYARRRYGKRSAANMLRVVRILARSVYSTYSRGNEAHHQHRLYHLARDSSKYPYLKALSRALDIALLEKDRQKDNPLYSYDLVDIAREYIGELCNCRLQEMYAAFVRCDAERFEDEAKTIGLLMDALETAIASRPEYCAGYLIRKARRTRPDTDVEDFIKDRMFTFARSIPWIIDYQSKDILELVRFYYRRRVQTYIEALRVRLRQAQPPHGPNLLANPGFEQGLQGWGTDFVHLGGRVTTTARGAASGRPCAQLRSPKKGGYANIYQDLEARGGEAFCFTAQVKVKGPCRAHLHVDFVREGGTWPSAVLAQEVVGAVIEGDADWQQARGWFIAPHGTGSIRAYCRQGGEGTAWFDEVQLQKVPAEHAPAIHREELEAAYRRIENEWLEKPLPAYRKPRRTAPEAVAEVLSNLAKVAQPKTATIRSARRGARAA